LYFKKVSNCFSLLDKSEKNNGISCYSTLDNVRNFLKSMSQVETSQVCFSRCSPPLSISLSKRPAAISACGASEVASWARATRKIADSFEAF